MSQHEADLSRAIEDAWDHISEVFMEVYKNFQEMWDGFMQLEDFKEEIAIEHGHRYWFDNRSQPRRNPTKQPLLHNGGKPR